MITKFEKRQRRQSKYRNRARSARLCAKLLIPVAMVFLTSALWSDPVLGPRLAQGVQEIKPVLAGYLEDTPLEDIFGPDSEVTNTQTAIEALEEASLHMISNPSQLAVETMPG